MPQRARIAFALAALLAGCGTGSKDSTAISLSTASLAFSAEAGGALPAAQTVRVTFQGDGVMVGYPPGVAVPSWLTIVPGATSAGTAEFSLGVTDVGAPGTRSATVRFVTGKADGSQLKYADVAVTCTVTAGAPTAIAASSGAVAFRAERGAAVPAAQKVVVTFEGDTARIGHPPGVLAPSWLTVTETARTATTLEVSLAVADTAAVGTRSTTLRFSTSRGGYLIKNVDVPVAYAIVTPFAAAAPAMTFSAIGGSLQAPQPSAGYGIAIQGDDARWRATSSAAWLRLGTASGTGPGGVSVTADAAGLAAGDHQATVVVTDDNTGRQVSFTATLTVRAPRLTATSPGTFGVDLSSTPAALARNVTISDELGGTAASWAVRWSLRSVSANWLQWSPASGSSSPASEATLGIDATKLPALANGSYTGSVVLSYDTADATGLTLTIPVSMTLCLPRPDRVAPYVATAGRAGHLYVRGAGFACTGPAPSPLLGTSELVRTVDSDTQIQADHPALAAGRYPLQIDNQLGIGLGSAELLVLTPPALTYQAISAPSTRGRLVYDAERSTLYAVNWTDQSIERYRLSGTSWSALPAIIVPSVRDVDLAPDGRSLLVATRGSLGDIDLTAATPTFASRVANPDTFCGGYFAQLAVANSGKALVVFDLAGCSGFSSSYLYDLRDHSLTRTTWLYNGLAAASADGSRVYMGSNGVSPAQRVTIFNALDNSSVDGPAAHNLWAASVSGDASRVILQGTAVYSRSLTLLGNLPSGGGVVASRDSSRAFVFRDDGAAGPRVEVYDLNGALTAGALYPLAKTVALTDSPSGAAGRRVEMATTPDDGAVFVSGDARILVVPVN